MRDDAHIISNQKVFLNKSKGKCNFSEHLQQLLHNKSMQIMSAILSINLKPYPATNTKQGT